MIFDYYTQSLIKTKPLNTLNMSIEKIKMIYPNVNPFDNDLFWQVPESAVEALQFEKIGIQNALFLRKKIKNDFCEWAHQQSFLTVKKLHRDMIHYRTHLEDNAYFKAIEKMFPNLITYGFSKYEVYFFEQEVFRELVLCILVKGRSGFYCPDKADFSSLEKKFIGYPHNRFP